MRYFHETKQAGCSFYGQLYKCNHPVYSRCTLYLEQGLGLAVIQQRYDPVTKRTYWTETDRELWDELYLQSGFRQFFETYARWKDAFGLYPTVTLRQIMWALRMKPLPKQPWETVFDHKPI